MEKGRGMGYIHGMAKMEDTIREKLTKALNPTHLDVINESHLHAGHAGDNGSGQSHFRVVVVSDSLRGLGRVAAQRKIYEILDDEMRSGIHALSISIQ
jgi:BolA protein